MFGVQRWLFDVSGLTFSATGCRTCSRLLLTGGSAGGGVVSHIAPEGIVHGAGVLEEGQMAVEHGQFAVGDLGGFAFEAVKVKRADKAGAVRAAFAMDEERLGRGGHDVDDLVELRLGQFLAGGKFVIVIADAELPCGVGFGAIPFGEAGACAAAQVEDAFDAVFLHDAGEVGDVQLAAAIDLSGGNDVEVVVEDEAVPKESAHAEREKNDRQEDKKSITHPAGSGQSKICQRPGSRSGHARCTHEHSLCYDTALAAQSSGKSKFRDFDVATMV